jgi:hypothetical protein
MNQGVLGGVAQLAEAKDLKSFQYGFESRLPYHYKNPPGGSFANRVGFLLARKL